MPKIGERFNPHRVFTGVFIPDAVYSHQSLSAAAKLIYGRLCKFKGERGEAYPAVITIAEELGISERQTFDHLSRLVDEGFIEREPRPGTSTVYHFLWHKSFGFEDDMVVRKAALPPQTEVYGNPHQCSAENRTTGSAENRIGSESIEVNQGSEEETHRTPIVCDDENPIPRFRKNQSWKKPKKPVDPNSRSEQLRRLREQATTVAESGVVCAIPTQQDTNRPPAVRSRPDNRSAIITQWNEAVPEAAIKPELAPRNPLGFQEPGLAENFPEICRLSREMIQAGAKITLGFLMSVDRTTLQYRWQQLLTNDLEWKLPKKSRSGQKAWSDDEEERQKKKEDEEFAWANKPYKLKPLPPL